MPGADIQGHVCPPPKPTIRVTAGVMGHLVCSTYILLSKPTRRYSLHFAVEMEEKAGRKSCSSQEKKQNKTEKALVLTPTLREVGLGLGERAPGVFLSYSGQDLHCWKIQWMGQRCPNTPGPGNRNCNFLPESS